MIKVRQLAKMIDHSLLHPTMTDKQLLEGCEIAKAHEVASVFIKPYAIQLAVEALEGTSLSIGTVIGFPQGSSCMDIKVAETKKACKDGATEIDMVVNIGKVLQEDWEYVEKEIKTVCRTAHSYGALVNVSFENDFLPGDSYKIMLCRICSTLEVDFVKTSTGYGFVATENGTYSNQGATHRDLKLMREHSADAVQVRAAGGVIKLDDLLALRALGVTRLETTATMSILQAARERFEEGPNSEIQPENTARY